MAVHGLPAVNHPCGNCGAQTCANTCAWGACLNQGVCSPGQTQVCGNCGQRVCSNSCSWGSCALEGPCSPKQVQTCNQGGYSGHQECDNMCKWGSCLTCADSIRNFDETDVDCGGSCKPCDWLGAICKVNADCVSRNCSAGSCACSGQWPKCVNSCTGYRSDANCGECGYVCGNGYHCTYTCPGGLCVDIPRMHSCCGTTVKCTQLPILQCPAFAPSTYLGNGTCACCWQ